MKQWVGLGSSSAKFIFMVSRIVFLCRRRADLRRYVVVYLSIFSVLCTLFIIWESTRREFQRTQSERVVQAQTIGKQLVQSTAKYLAHSELVELESLLQETARLHPLTYLVLKTPSLEKGVLTRSRQPETADVLAQVGQWSPEFSPDKAGRGYHQHFPIEVAGEVAGHLYLGWIMPASAKILAGLFIKQALIIAPIMILFSFIAMQLGRRFKAAFKHHYRIKARTNAPQERWAMGQAKSDPVEQLPLRASAHSLMRQLKQNIKQVQTLTYQDPFTKLPNRAAFEMQIARATDVLSKEQKSFAICFVTIDAVRRINNSFGHEVGDRLILQISTRLSNALCAVESKLSGLYNVNVSGAVHRVGGADFAYFFPGIGDERASLPFVDAIQLAMQAPFFVGLHKFFIDLYIGLAFYPSHGRTRSQILNAATLAIHHAKREKIASPSIFTPAMRTQATLQMRLEADLKATLATNGLSVEFQPKVNLISRQIVGVEALARWNHKKYGFISPEKFIPIAEQNHLINELGIQVLEQAISAAMDWSQRNFKVPVAVNVSTLQLLDKKFVDYVRGALNKAKLPPSMLELEITETAAFSSHGAGSQQVIALQSDGVRFAIDDFGTGYSNLAQLRKLPFDIFKIDRSFTANLCHNNNTRIIVETIIAMAKALKYSTVAEGVETEEEAQLLNELGCPTGQGFLFSKAMPLSSLLAVMEQQERDGKHMC